jgi:cytochrome c553
MKKLMIIVLAMLVFASLAMAQSNPVYTQGQGIQGIDKLGAHQNGGRGCVGCHAPHSGGRGNGGVFKWNGTAYVSQAVVGDSGDEVLWGQDLGPIYGLGTIKTGANGAFDLSVAATAQERVITGVVMCLSCHDGNVAKGAMMTNQSFEQAANLLPPGYGTQAIPTLLGADGGSAGNYENDHPIGPKANVGALPIAKYLGITATNVTLLATQPDTKYTDFIASYGAPIVNARVGAGFAVDSTMTATGQAYVVCTTCHTPHTMYTASASATNKIAGLSAGVFPSYFFIAAPYNPGADVAGGTKASSATQFCRQCHFTGAGGSNEGSGIKIPTAF